MNAIFFLFKMFLLFFESLLQWNVEYTEGSVIIIVCSWLNVFSRANNKNVNIIMEYNPFSLSRVHTPSYTGWRMRSHRGKRSQSRCHNKCCSPPESCPRLSLSEYFPSLPTLMPDSPSPQLMQQLDPNLQQQLVASEAQLLYESAQVFEIWGVMPSHRPQLW